MELRVRFTSPAIHTHTHIYICKFNTVGPSGDAHANELLVSGKRLEPGTHIRAVD